MLVPFALFLAGIKGINTKGINPKVNVRVRLELEPTSTPLLIALDITNLSLNY